MSKRNLCPVSSFPFVVQVRGRKSGLKTRSKDVEVYVFIPEPYWDGMEGMKVGDEIIVITWLHRAGRDALKVHPRDDASRPLTGVFLTRAPNRPNPLGLHRAKVLAIDQGCLLIGPIEAINGTPVIDIKPVV